MDSLSLNIKRWMLILGVAQIAFGCTIGLVPPTAVQWFRGLVMAHIEYVTNGMLLIVFGFLVPELKLGKLALKTWFVTLQVGAWAGAGLAGLMGAILGFSSPLLPLINEKFPAPRGMDHPLVTGPLLLGGVTTMIGLALTLWGLFSNRKIGEKAL